MQLSLSEDGKQMIREGFFGGVKIHEIYDRQWRTPCSKFVASPKNITAGL